MQAFLIIKQLNSMKNSLLSKTKFVIMLCCISFLALAGVAGAIYSSALSASSKNTQVVYIDIYPSYSISEVTSTLEQKASLSKPKSFLFLSNIIGYSSEIKTGRYEITPNESNLNIIRKLKSGHQAPVKLTFNNVRTKEDLASKLTKNIMCDSVAMLALLNNKSVYEKYGFTDTTFLAMFIPNTYQVYWNTSCDRILDRLNNEYNKFWNEKRRQQADSIGLSPIEVSTLASIVEEESAYLPEYPLIAGMYLNRLKVKMPLQADPTVKYAVGDFSIRRVLHSHLETQSPYNTYLITGLPPGPIRIPSIQAIEAVLNSAQHDYYYMCASPDFSGKHVFAKNLTQHSVNAQRYRSALNRRNIR